VATSNGSHPAVFSRTHDAVVDAAAELCAADDAAAADSSAAPLAPSAAAAASLVSSSLRFKVAIWRSSTPTSSPASALAAATGATIQSPSEAWKEDTAATVAIGFFLAEAGSFGKGMARMVSKKSAKSVPRGRVRRSVVTAPVEGWQRTISKLQISAASALKSSRELVSWNIPPRKKWSRSSSAPS